MHTPCRQGHGLGVGVGRSLARLRRWTYDRTCARTSTSTGRTTIKPTAPFATRAATTALALALVTVAVLPTTGVAQDQGPFDLLVRGGRVLDGTGNPWFRADIGVRDGRIVSVGLLDGATADRIVDATGRYVSPGFIDIHSHADDGSASVGGATIRTDSLHRKAAPNVVSQGVTTVVVNHDGRSPWPIRDQRYLLEGQGVGPNVMLMVGHGTVRRRVLGDDYQRPSTEAEVEEMRTLVRQALEEGAVGMSAGLEYTPGRWSTTDEVARMAEELVPYDGVYISHERSEGADPMWFWPSQDDPGPPTLQDAVLETIEIGRHSGARVVASHIKAKGAHFWGSSTSAIQLIERARAEGVRVFADQYPYATSGSDGNTVLIPRWATAAPGSSDGDGPGPAEMLRRNLADAERATMIRRDIAHEIRRRGGADRVVVFEYPREEWVGKNLRDIADERGIDPVQMAIDLALEGDPDRRGGGRLRGFSMSEIDVENYAAQPWVATASDGGIAIPEDGSVHPRFYGTFPRKIRHYAMTAGALSVEEAIRSQTSLPARIMGLQDRGEIRVGHWADLVVFDMETIADEATFFEPHQHAEGIDHVFVNGEAVVRDGAILYRLPGRIITSRRGGLPVSEEDPQAR
ncbi:MAG: amidohydrolase family protein [Gemmatimonadetes bacterium]|nr:amidohydrolase family protein [Gemmatimonadota bacterium]